jgi:hypothetical protein
MCSVASRMRLEARWLFENVVEKFVGRAFDCISPWFLAV